MIFQLEGYDLLTALTPIFTLFLLVFLLVLMLICYRYFPKMIIILIVFAFSLVIGALSTQIGDIPFTPYFQIFFILFQSAMFILSVYKTMRLGK